MSKEDWVRCYENARDRGLGEKEAEEAASMGEVNLEAARIDEALELLQESRLRGQYRGPWGSR